MNDLSTKGKSFKEVQYLLKGYKKQGVLLALCSKNNLHDVLNVLEQNGEKGKVIIMSGSEDSEIENYPFLLKNEFLAEKLVANYC